MVLTKDWSVPLSGMHVSSYGVDGRLHARRCETVMSEKVGILRSNWTAFLLGPLLH